jgi:hypothetical protein
MNYTIQKTTVLKLPSKEICEDSVSHTRIWYGYVTMSEDDKWLRIQYTHAFLAAKLGICSQLSSSTRAGDTACPLQLPSQYFGDTYRKSRTGSESRMVAGRKENDTHDCRLFARSRSTPS